MKMNKIGRKVQLKVNGAVLDITASLNDDCKNGHEHFSLTYEKYIRRFGRRDYIGGGCAKDSDDEDVRRAIRLYGLEAVERVHLCDMNGVPIHALQNATYWAKQGEREYFQRMLRLTEEEAEKAFYVNDELGLYVWLNDHGILTRWKQEANEAIAAIISGRDIEFESAATKPMGHLYFNCTVTDGAIRAQRDLFRDGYYAPEKAKERWQRSRLDECLKRIDSRIEIDKQKIEQQQLEIKVEQAIRLVLESHFAEFEKPLVVAENNILYTHKNELTFNWRGYGFDKVTDNDYALVQKYLGPYCEKMNITISKKG